MAEDLLDPLVNFEQRKRDHINLSLRQKNQALGMSGLDDIKLPHEAIPDIDLDDIDISSIRFDKHVTNPFMVSSMTAGHGDAININRRLMSAAAHCGWVMGVGSQRKELHDPKASLEWQDLRKLCPDTDLFGNIGMAQLISHSISDIQRLIETLDAKAMIVHSNPLQECIQIEGTPTFKGSWRALEQLCRKLEIPVIVKETGCGFSAKTLSRLTHCGISAVDVSGLGGTHWGRIEGDRSPDKSPQQQAASSFQNWGISTVASVQNAAVIRPNYEVWGSGGVRSGLDAAKLLALGASTVGFAKPLLEAALQGTESLIALMETISFELKVALFCTGSTNIERLRENYHGIE